MPLWQPDIWQQQLRDAAFYWLLVPGAVILSGLALDRLLGIPAVPAEGGLTAGALMLLIAGAGIIAKATRDFEQLGRGTPNPLRPPKILVTTGSYRWCRHPMFLGYDLAALGVILLLHSWAMLLVSFPILLGWQFRFLRREEELLFRRFRGEYDGYRRQVPMLLPWPRPRATIHPEE